MDANRKQPAEDRVLKVEGNWTIERAQEMRQRLIKALAEEDRITLELEEMREADLTCLQLLCSAHRTSLKWDKHFALGEEKPEALIKAVREAGFVRTLGCHKDPHKGCLWIEGWGP